MQALLGEAREGLSDGEEAISNGEASVINGGQLLNEARGLIQVYTCRLASVFSPIRQP